MKKRFCGGSILLIGLSFQPAAQLSESPLASAYANVCAYSRLHPDILSMAAQPATMAELKKAMVGFYGERRFALAELNDLTAAVALPARHGNFGFTARYKGFADYRETAIGLAYAMKLGEKAGAGIQLIYTGTGISPGYGSHSNVGAGGGLILHLDKQLHAGFRFSMRSITKPGAEQTLIPALYSFGIGFDASDKFHLGITVSKETQQPVQIDPGFQYRIRNTAWVRAGVMTAISSPWLALGVQLRSFRTDITAAWHPQLGITPGMALFYDFNPERK